jgi:hypothetical protein
MNITGIMQRTFPGYGIKGAGVGIADVLDFPGQGGKSLVDFQSNNPGKNIPGRPARGAPFHFNGGYPAILDLHPVLRQTKLAAVCARRLQTSEAASGKRRHGVGMFFSGGNDRYFFLPADFDKIG